eukprot:scaffold191962_cov31-Prasinocladus_malaysianus.AAC.2
MMSGVFNQSIAQLLPHLRREKFVNFAIILEQQRRLPVLGFWVLGHVPMTLLMGAINLCNDCRPLRTLLLSRLCHVAVGGQSHNLSAEDGQEQFNLRRARNLQLQACLCVDEPQGARRKLALSQIRP